MNDSPAPPSNLATAKLAVMAQVPYLRKSKANGLSYTFASEREFIRQLHPAMIQHGLAFAAAKVQLAADEQYQTGKGAHMNRVILLVTYRLTHAASGQSEDIEAAGEGSDIGDKATGKAMTSALKYALRQTFLIETGDDPDRSPSEGQQRDAQPRPAAAPAPQPAANGHAPAPRPAAAPARDPGEVLTQADHQLFTQMLYRHKRTWPKVGNWLSGADPTFPPDGKSTDLTYGQATRIRKALEKTATKGQPA